MYAIRCHEANLPEVPCDHCDGEGTEVVCGQGGYRDETCSFCDGTGTIPAPIVPISPDGETFDSFDEALQVALTDSADGFYPEGTFEEAQLDARDVNGYRLDVPHVTGPTYRVAIVEASSFSDAHVRDDEEAIAFLTCDTGSIPCSRYGRDSSSCAPVALLHARLVERATGELLTFRMLDSDMGAVVNDSDDIAWALLDSASDADLESAGLDREDICEWFLEDWSQHARNAGRDAARAAATWASDGNSDRDSIACLLARMDEGEDVEQYLPRRPDLSGEWAGDPTPISLARNIAGFDDVPGSIVDALSDAFEEGVDDVFESACEAILREAIR